MVDNELLILVYETLQSLSGGVKDMKSSVQALNAKIETINKRVSELEGTINNVISPGIMTIGEGHEDVHKVLYDTCSKMKQDFKKAQNMISDDLYETKVSFNSELHATQQALNHELSETRDALHAELEEINRTHAALRAKFETYELKQQRFEQELKKKY